MRDQNIILATSLSFLVAISSQAAATDDAAVLRAVLDFGCRPQAGTYSVLSSETQPVTDLDQLALSSEQHAVQDLIARNATPVTLPMISNCPGVRVVAQSEITAAFAQRAEDANPLHYGWEGFWAHFPNASELLRVSLPGYSTDGRTAIVTFSGSRGLPAGGGALVTLRKVRRRWKVVQRKSLWVS